MIDLINQINSTSTYQEMVQLLPEDLLELADSLYFLNGEDFQATKEQLVQTLESEINNYYNIQEVNNKLSILKSELNARIDTLSDTINNALNQINLNITNINSLESNQISVESLESNTEVLIEDKFNEFNTGLVCDELKSNYTDSVSNTNGILIPFIHDLNSSQSIIQLNNNNTSLNISEPGKYHILLNLGLSAEYSSIEGVNVSESKNVSFKVSLMDDLNNTYAYSICTILGQSNQFEGTVHFHRDLTFSESKNLNIKIQRLSGTRGNVFLTDSYLLIKKLI